VVFYVLACAISWPLFWWRWAYPESWAASKGPKHLLYMWGPGLAAIIVMLIVFRAQHLSRRTISFLGTSAWRSLVFWFAPLLLLGAAYWPELAKGDGWTLIPLLATIGYLTILGEELGWRGFLQDALRPLPRLPRYVLIGVMWELWHFTTRWSDRTPLGIALVLAFTITVVIVLSFIIGEATDRGRSLTVAVTLHAWANMMFEAGDVFHAPPLRAWLVGAACVPLWGALLWTWPRQPGLEVISVKDEGPMTSA
jgi:membrane protease YdiL (CAAX protease family)